MKRIFSSLLALLIICPLPAAAIQKARLPRNADRLVVRSQEFWAALVAGQKVQALEFIPPDKKASFIERNSAPISEARVLGFDLTEDVNRAKVRVEVGIVANDFRAGRAKVTISDTWVWRNNDWFFEIADPADFLGSGQQQESKDVQEIQKQIDSAITLVTESVDLGTIVQGQVVRHEIKIRYTGELPLSIDSLLGAPLLSVLEPTGKGITAGSSHFLLVVNTESWSGSFAIPFRVRFKHEAAVVERTVTVNGSVFVPLSFRQEPETVPIRAGELVTVFVKNNTPSQVPIRYITVDNKLDILSQPTVLEPDQEAELKLRLRPGELPDRLYVTLDAPLHGRDIYSYQFRTGR